MTRKMAVVIVNNFCSYCRFVLLCDYTYTQFHFHVNLFSLCNQAFVQEICGFPPFAFPLFIDCVLAYRYLL